MSILGASILIVVVLVVLFASRPWALIGMMAGVLYLTQGQELVILGFNLTAIRFIEFAGFVRVVFRSELSFSALNGIDRVVLFLYSYTTIVYLVRSNVGQANQIGYALDALLCYFAFRGLVTSIDDFVWFLRKFLILLTPFVALLFIESFTNHNPFAAMGVYGDAFEGMFREGRIRAFGSFRHPSLLGTLGGSFLPLYIGLAFTKKFRNVAFLGIALCLAIVWVSNSGGPINCVAAGMVGWMLWTVRTKMRWIRRGMVAALSLGALLMKAPIWYLPAKLSNISGGDGWHRSYLLDIAFQHIDTWWLAGIPLLDTASWFPYHLAAGGSDLTNYFLNFGITAGIGSIFIFIFLLVLSFRNLGNLMKRVRSDGRASGNEEFIYWGLSVMLAVHIVNWFGIAYFDQTYVLWFMQLATISSLAQFSLVSVRSDHSREVSKTRTTGHSTPRLRPKHAMNRFNIRPLGNSGFGSKFTKSGDEKT